MRWRRGSVPLSKESRSQFNFLTPSQLTIQATSHSAVFYLYFLTLGIFTTKGVKNYHGTIMQQKSLQRRLKASDVQHLQYNLGLLVLCRYVVIFNVYISLVLNMHMIYMFEWICMYVDEATWVGRPFKAGTVCHSPSSNHWPVTAGWHGKHFWSTSHTARGLLFCIDIDYNSILRYTDEACIILISWFVW